MEDWTSGRLALRDDNGTRSLTSGSGNTSLSLEESTLYRNYVIATQNATLQALLGITQGMGIIDVVWRHQ